MGRSRLVGWLLLLLVRAKAFRIAVVGVHRAPARLAAWRCAFHGWEVTRIGTRSNNDVFDYNVHFDHVFVDRTAVTPRGESLLQCAYPRATHHYIVSTEEAIRTVDGLFGLKM